MTKKDWMKMRIELNKAWSTLEHCKERIYLYNGTNEYSDRFCSSLFEIQEKLVSMRDSLINQVD